MTDDLRVALYACKGVLAKLQVLSDAPTSHIRTEGIAEGSVGAVGLRTRDSHGMGVKGGRFTGSRPPGRLDDMDGTGMLGNGHAPSKQLSLYAHYLWRMQRAQKAEDVDGLRRLVAMAERDYEEYQGRRHPRQHTNDSAAITELLRDWTGWEAAEAAMWLHASVRWVKRQRVLHGRDPLSGEPREFDERTRHVIVRTLDGATQADIAKELGVSRPRVSQILAGG